MPASRLRPSDLLLIGLSLALLMIASAGLLLQAQDRPAPLVMGTVTALVWNGQPGH